MDKYCTCTNLYSEGTDGVCGACALPISPEDLAQEEWEREEMEAQKEEQS